MGKHNCMDDCFLYEMVSKDSPCSRSYMWVLFVRPEVCLHLPSDSTSRWTPLVFSDPLPTTGFGTFTL